MDVAVVMPAYEPMRGLPGYVRALQTALDAAVVVVDDGSSDACREVFAAVAAIPGCTVLRHDSNRGKGTALKTGFAHVTSHLPNCSGVLTVDADGQHALEDCRRVATAVCADGARALHLGTRDFAFRSTPFRSWWGNRCTSLLFAALFGRWVPDTQTGLRAFRREDLPFFLSVPGTGYEYEMAALATAARARFPFRRHPIRTIYEAGNASSHFQPLRDTIRIHRALFRAWLGIGR